MLHNFPSVANHKLEDLGVDFLKIQFNLRILRFFILKEIALRHFFTFRFILDMADHCKEWV